MIPNGLDERTIELLNDYERILILVLVSIFLPTQNDKK
jgi:hypothetical protein